MMEHRFLHLRVRRWLACALVLVLGQTLAPTDASSQTFDDVPPSYWAYTYVESLAASRITAGCSKTSYCPTGSVTRAQMAVFLLRGIYGSSYVPPPASGTVFQDVPANSFAANFIEKLYSDRITAGCGGDNYCPTSAVTRAQMAVFLLRAKYGASYQPPPATGVFADVPPGSFAANFIEKLAAEGITAGCGNGKFCPATTVTRAQMAVFLVRTFSLPIVTPALKLKWDEGSWDQAEWQ